MQKMLTNILKPTSIRDIIGQNHILNDHSGIINRMLNNNFVTSLLFFGPPGVGKTSLAVALANDLNIKYVIYNAAIDNKENLIKNITNATNYDRFIIIIDEIHRMNKDKQDILLNYLEQDNIYIFCCTTENPFFTVNPAIRSRCTLLELNKIPTKDIVGMFEKILSKPNYKLDIDTEAINYLAEISNGDLRVAIKRLEILLNLYSNEKINLELTTRIFALAAISGSYNSDEFHDLKSALQKSIRGSDVNAALHYFARLLAIGDYDSLMRRMLVIAYEDVGLANPQIPTRVLHAIDSFKLLGMPEGIYPLGLAIVDMAISPKSNSASQAANKAYEDATSGSTYGIPKYLQDAHYKSASKLNRGIGYKYPHDYGGWVRQQYLPDEIKDKIYFNFKDNNPFELKAREVLERFIKQCSIKK